MAQQPPLVISGGHLINTNDGKIINNSIIIIENNLITEVGKAGKLTIPANAQRIDATGKWIMPGMTDSHIHFFQSGGLYTRPDGLNLQKIYAYEKDQQWINDNLEDLLLRYLACGITTVIDVGGPFSNYTIRQYCNEHPLAPNAFVTGPLISTYLPQNLSLKDPPIIKVNSEAEARELVRKQLPYKPDFIKIWYIVLPRQSAAQTLPIVKATIEESHKNNLKVAVHATEYATAKLAVEAGCDILVHSIDDKVADPAFLQLLKSKNITYIPTLIVLSKYHEVFTQQHRLSLHDFRYSNPFMLGTLFDLRHLSTKQAGFDYMKLRNRLKIPSREDSTMLLNLKLTSDAGINISAGTDAGNIGTQHASSFLDELLSMKQSGMSNAQILKAATINPAKGFGKEKELGTIEKGKIADLLILNKNPLDSLGNLDNILLLVHRGKLIRTDTLLKQTPEILVQQQLNAYNAGNLEAFLEPYSDSIEIYDFPDTLNAKGKENMRRSYEPMFKFNKGFHCELVNRIVDGNKVIDQEKITGAGFLPMKASVIYIIENGKIRKVYFMKS